MVRTQLDFMADKAVWNAQAVWLRVTVISYAEDGGTQLASNVCAFVRLFVYIYIYIYIYTRIVIL
jgi:hypothetical protein